MDTEQTDKIIYEKVKKLISWNSVKEFFIFVLFVSLAIIAYDEAQKRIMNYTYNQVCISELEACNNTGFTVSCGKIGLNYSFSPNSSAIKSSSS